MTDLELKFRESMIKGDDLFEEIVERCNGNKGEAGVKLANALAMCCIRRAKNSDEALYGALLIIEAILVTVKAYFLQAKS